jgi:hypothetical protein
MKSVWIIAPFSDIDDPKSANRFQYIAKLLEKK